MNDLWCLRQIEEYDDSYHTDWEIASLESTSTTEAKISSLDHSQVLSWAQRQKQHLEKSQSSATSSEQGGVAIL